MKTMITRTVAAGLLAGVAAASPASDATLYVGHGINGKDLGLAQELAVDVCLVGSPLSLPNPTELLSDVKFGDEFAKIPGLPAGRYDVEVRLASSGNCNGTLAVASSIFLGIGETATALAHLTEFGTATLTKFVNDVRPLEDGETRLYAHHAAAFGDVDVFLKKGHRKVLIRGLENPDQEGATLKAGNWYVAILPSGSWHPAFDIKLPLASKFAYFAYAVGSPAGVGGNTFTVLLQAIDLN